MRRFTLREDHIKLLRHMYVGWCGDEFGAPKIDPKRPYGNSDVIRDIAKILRIEPAALDDGWGEPLYDAEQVERMKRLHQETRTALQIVLATGGMEPGEYAADDYSENWRPAAPTPNASPNHGGLRP